MLPENFEIDKGIVKLQEGFGLSNDFFEKILADDDWSFVIKLHALIEACCSSLLVNHFEEPALKNVISRLELSNKTNGKVAFLKELGLLNDANRRFISSLSELRNKFVHNVQFCNVSLSAIVEAMDSNAIKKFAVDFSPYESMLQNISKVFPDLLDGQQRLQPGLDKLIQRAILNPKFHIWLGAYNLLVSIVDMHDYSNFVNWDWAMSIAKSYQDDVEE